jgi:hypothetical protein
LFEGGQVDRTGQCGPDRGSWTAHAIKSGTRPSIAFHPVQATL